MSTTDSHIACDDAYPARLPHRDGHVARVHHPRGGAVARRELRLVPDLDRGILVAGADPVRRAAVMGELMSELPASTLFEEAIDACTVLERARSSHTVIVVGDLVDASSGTIMQLLGHHNPGLPVMALGRDRAGAGDRSLESVRTACSSAC